MLSTYYQKIYGFTDGILNKNIERTHNHIEISDISAIKRKEELEKQGYKVELRRYNKREPLCVVYHI
ncbi:MAG: hypothetical protein ACPLRZ_11505 [Thermovenabulum sp.]|uniref:hypothetical protein n=1 Tax=Thermovenabulum sp. TaxID=3100335 RepID=UPI003C7B7CB5